MEVSDALRLLLDDEPPLLVLWLLEARWPGVWLRTGGGARSDTSPRDEDSASAIFCERTVRDRLLVEEACDRESDMAYLGG